jgi:hypothetical protein
LNVQIKSYADSIYEKVLMESAAATNADSTTHLSEMAAKQSRYIPLGGSQIQAIIRFHVKHIERCMAARLDSYEKAFAEAGQNPTEQDFTDILNAFKAVQELQVNLASASIGRFLTARSPSIPVDQRQALLAGSAHGHDRVLRNWKVWREKARLHQATAVGPEPPKQLTPQTKDGWAQVGQVLWSWPVIGVAAAVPLGFAGNAVYAGDMWGTGLLCFLGIALLTVKFLLWDKTRDLPYRKVANITVLFIAVLLWCGALGWAHARGLLAETRPLLTMKISPSSLPLSIPPYFVTSVLQLHPFVGLTDKQDGLLKIANDTGREGCWPSQKELGSMGPNAHENVYRVEIGNHSQRTLASGKVVFELKYNAGSRGGGCMPPSGAPFDQKDVVLLPPLEPGKSFDFFAVNQSNRCAWLIPPDSAIVRMDGDEKDRDVTLTFDKDPLYAAGAPVFSASAIEWEGVRTKPGGYGIVRTGPQACANSSKVLGAGSPFRSEP